MKSILYVGAALMLGASVYGFVDYRNTKSKKEFSEMYSPKESPDPELTKPDPAVIEEKAPVKTEKMKAASIDEKVPSVIEEKFPAKTEKTKAAVIQVDDPVVIDMKADLVSGKSSPSAEKVAGVSKKNKHGKKKKVSYKLFSRAAPSEMIVPITTKPVDKPATKPGRQ